MICASQSNMAEIACTQLVQLAEYNLRMARRRQTDKMESLWLCLQSVILLQSAIDKMADFRDHIPSPESQQQQSSRESIHTKMANARNELQNVLLTLITNKSFDFGKSSSDAMISDWLQGMLEYFKNKFINGEAELIQKKEVKLHRREREAARRVVRSRRRVSEPMIRSNGCLIPPYEKTESIRDRVSYESMMMKFTTATAAKYGVNVLDPFSHKVIEDYRNANVSLLPERELRTETTSNRAPTMRRRSTSILEGHRALRPQSLDLGRTNADLTNKITTVVSDLKSRAERLQRRNSIASPVISWQTAIKQHKSMISEILNDFSVEQLQDQNSNNDFASSVLSPDDYLHSLSQKYSFGRHNEDSIESVQLSYETTTKTVTQQHYQNSIEKCSSPRNQTTIDSNGNRNEIYRRSSILDNDIRVTYARSGSLTPESASIHRWDRRSYSLHSFEPISPLTEICSLPWDQRSSCCATPLTPTPDIPGSVSISEDDILHALADSILEIANRNFDIQRYAESQSLYEQALSILNRIYKFSGKFEPSIIPTMKQCGLIRKYRGDSLGAMGIFEQCIGVIEKREDGQCAIEYRLLIAELWYEMGNALILDGKHSETIGHSVIDIMREQETADLLDAPRSVSSDMDLEQSYNAYTTKGQSYPVGAFEAMSCYQKAYCIVEVLKVEKGDEIEFSELSAKILLKIGDCSVLIGDLEVGAGFYERALECFKTTDAPYSLSDNAHVLVMMGFLQYTVGRYSKAVVMLQCATIMFHRMETNGERYEKTEFAMVKSLLSFSHFETGQYSKSVSLGVQAKRLYEEIFGDEMDTVNKSYTWLIAQSLFIVAKAYYSMKLYQQALETLRDLTNIFGPKSNLETILRVRVLELMAQCYEAMDHPNEALVKYNEALEAYRGQINYGYASSALEHTLLSRTAGLHVTMQHYSEAAMYLDRSYASRHVEEDIRSDMVTLLHHLGETHTLASHVQRAIDCFNECVDVYIEIHGQLGPDITKTLGKLANMYHVKAVQSHHQDKESLFEAEKIYQQAIDIDFSPVLALRYANFLFHQKSYFEAIYILQQILETEMELKEITFAGVEQILIPVMLQAECDEDELTIAGKLLVQYLLVSSFTAIGKLRTAEYYVLDMIYETDMGDTLGLSVIGYSLLEMKLYTEAYAWFHLADKSSHYPASTIAWENKLFCVALEIFRCLRRGILFLYESKYGFGTFPSSLAFIP